MEFSKNSKVWVYQSNRFFNPEEVARLETFLNSFAKEWTAHKKELVAKAMLIHNLFVVLMVDESMNAASGCSIDKSVHFLKFLQDEFKVDFFDRFRVAYRNEEGEVVTCDKIAFEKLIFEGIIQSDTIVFNNLVKTLDEFENHWEAPFKESWHNRVFMN